MAFDSFNTLVNYTMKQKNQSIYIMNVLIKNKNEVIDNFL